MHIIVLKITSNMLHVITEQYENKNTKKNQTTIWELQIQLHNQINWYYFWN